VVLKYFTCSCRFLFFIKNFFLFNTQKLAIPVQILHLHGKKLEEWSENPESFHHKQNLVQWTEKKWFLREQAVAKSDSQTLVRARSILKQADEHQLIYECLTLARAVDSYEQV
jgi:hypothetical protein